MTAPRLPLVYLGTHMEGWLDWLGVPLFVSHRRLLRRKRLPRAIDHWALDSGGFSELSLHGRWVTSPRDYAAAVRRYRDEIGRLDWAAIQDWMCEPFMLQKTGLSLAEHQRRTIQSYEALLALDPELPWCPVLQGWERDDYLRHLDAYLLRGHDLHRLPVVGLGSVCRRQHTAMAERLVRDLASSGLRLHGFGFKTRGLMRLWDSFHSTDSLAWSYDARRAPPPARLYAQGVQQLQPVGPRVARSPDEAPLAEGEPVGVVHASRQCAAAPAAVALKVVLTLSSTVGYNGG